MSSEFTLPAIPAILPADRSAVLVRPLPAHHANSSLAVRPEAALAVVTETLMLATSELHVKWERKRDALHHRHVVALQEATPQEWAKINENLETVAKDPNGVCAVCGATTKGAWCSQQCAAKAAEAANARMAKVQAEVDETIDRETAALESAARAEIHDAEMQALQLVDRATLKAALAASAETYHAACRKAYGDAGGTYEDRLEAGRLRATLDRLLEAWDALLQREREERVRHTGIPQRYCQVCFIPVVEECLWCSRQCEDAAGAGKHYQPRAASGLFQCEWCGLYFWVPDPDAAGIRDTAPFCSRPCLEASAVDLAEHADTDFATVKRIAPPPSTIAGRQRAVRDYLRRFVEGQGRRQSRPYALPCSGIEVTVPGEAPAVPDHPDAVAVVRTLLLERLGPQASLIVRPGRLRGDLGARLGSEPTSEAIGRWLRDLGAQRLGKDGHGARYLVVGNHLRQ